jgi:hypothetical protein
VKIPREVERKVVAYLYSQAGEVDWGSMSPQEHSRQYGKWVSDPEVGGKLTEYLTTTDARVWIKDGPMKEWSRARSGVGKYADLIEGAQNVQDAIVAAALGEGWEADKDSIKGKPLRLIATHATEERETVVVWGPPSDLKHLAWAALVAQADGDSRDWVLCIVGTLMNPTPANDKIAHQRVATRCGLRLTHISI